MKFLVLKKETLLFFLAVGVVLATISAWFMLKAGDVTVFNQQANKNIREIHMVTGEFKSTLKNGKEIEAYRWDPGTISLEKGEKVKLYISGINGAAHPFYIEGTKIKGTVKKGEETVVTLQFKKEGTYRLICETHSDRSHNGPMIAYIVVD
ncbi:cupredoxin domain-containing protein [Paenibacillus sp. BSR1-1]|uniref:cupredoxin domain-containing protein n=1 Tax=Paenibacillus sp. BSR1-1 TaxID=3020845 RepID=UPI0025B114D9|nr:cupredoxin domain-containing protein [Paenibacillus sp. BSR1-1]MDN3019321.1 cupredoxin domain-containing protein [Paenibacillus sp. BSR1-1]